MAPGSGPNLSTNTQLHFQCFSFICLVKLLLYIMTKNVLSYIYIFKLQSSLRPNYPEAYSHHIVKKGCVHSDVKSIQMFQRNKSCSFI